MKFQIFKGKDKQFYFRIVADNGETVCISEAYRTRAMAQKTIKAIESALSGISGWFGLRFNGEDVAFFKYENDLLDLEGSYLGQEGKLERFQVGEK